MIEQTVTCDACGTVKKEVNHWWIVYLRKNGELAIKHANQYRPLKCIDVCGQSCVHMILDRWMATGSIEKS